MATIRSGLEGLNHVNLDQLTALIKKILEDLEKAKKSSEDADKKKKADEEAKKKKEEEDKKKTGDDADAFLKQVLEALATAKKRGLLK